jgi:teichuronic acid biosynthesis glycosyltransferase TuaC
MVTERPRIAFFTYPDVFEDFYPHYGVTRAAFATKWGATGSHALVSVLQRHIGDVTWYESSLEPELLVAEHELGFRVRFVPSSWLHRRLWRSYYLSSRNLRNLYPAYALLASYSALWSRALLRTLRRDKPDVIVAQEYSSGRFDTLWSIAKLLKIPLVAFHAGGLPERYVGKLTKRWTIPRADALVVSSRSEQEMLASRYNAPRGRMFLVLTPIDTDLFRPLDRGMACSLSGLDPDCRWLLFVGRLDDRVKRIGALISAFGELAYKYPDVGLAIVGDGRDKDRLRTQASLLSEDRVRFLGWKSGAKELAPLYNAADCLLLPSWSEGFPTVVGEAMSCGTPVLASRVGGVPELVKEGESGWMIQPGDDVVLRERMEWVLSHAGEVASMRQVVREHALARVSESVVAAQLLECFARAGVSHIDNDAGVLIT